MITVWGRDTSSNVQMVVWALTELGVAYERVDAGGKYGRLETEDFLLLNPNRLVPVLQDGDLTMWESAAIVRYLGAAYGDAQFWPPVPRSRAAVDKWAEWIKTTFGPTLLTQVFWQLISNAEHERDGRVLAAGIARLKLLTPMLDSRLATSNFLGGEDICFADIMVGTLLYRYYTLGFERVEAPNLRAYYDRLARRPAYAKHVMVSYESLRAK